MSKVYYKRTTSPLFKKAAKISGVGFMGIGVLLLIYFIFPLVAYNIFLSPALASNTMEVPIPKYLVASQDNKFTSLISQGIASLTSDYTDARNWYPQITAQKVTTKEDSQIPDVDTFYLSIPKLGIENATVSRNNYDLSQNLVDYYGVSNPIKKGTSVIFGHSTLPQWFNPKNYKAIFATLHTIKVGDEIVLQVDRKNYTYKIFSVSITSPDDTNIFSQSYDNSYITIITCTPPGTTWRRLVVRASMI